MAQTAPAGMLVNLCVAFGSDARGTSYPKRKT